MRGEITPLIMLMLFASASSATMIDCHDCTDCSAKIQNATLGDTILLTGDITDCNRTCIEFAGADMITFDGGGYTISGTQEIQTYGIRLPVYSCNNVVTNVTVSDFWTGIYLFVAYNNDIKNVTSSNNHDCGLEILYCFGNKIQDCVFQENKYDDFYFRPDVPQDCNNTLINVTGSRGRPIGYYNSNTTFKDLNFASLYLCDADNSSLQNITVDGAYLTNNNALRMFFTDNATLTDIESTGNFGGIFIEHSNYNNITRAIFNDSHHYNIFMNQGTGNKITDTVTCNSSQCGAYLYHSPGNTLQGMTIRYNSRGIMLDNSDDTTISKSQITHNHLHGIIGGSHNNRIYNNYFSGNPEGVCGISSDWNISPILGTNIIGGSYIGGNYWSNYTGTDSDGDGFGDDPYDTSCGIDHFPLVYPPEWLCGDVDGNGYVSANDCVEAHRRAVDPNYPLTNEWAADVDGNGHVSANDVVEIYATAIDPDHSLNCI